MGDTQDTTYGPRQPFEDEEVPDSWPYGICEECGYDPGVNGTKIDFVNGRHRERGLGCYENNIEERTANDGRSREFHETDRHLHSIENPAEIHNTLDEYTNHPSEVHKTLDEFV